MVNEVAGKKVAGKKRINHKTLLSSLTSSRNGKIFKGNKHGHFLKFCEGFNTAKWSKMAKWR